ncbi:MAG: AraC family transcriptional regulator [Halieaceae bacterium]|nr:AraC family transcriptional regulator [Halieaceae bacterium]
MSIPSTWPLPDAGIRFITPAFMIGLLARHPLTKDCYPTAMGYYPQASGHRMRRQRHDDNLLIYCAAGRGSLAAGDWSGRIGPGQLILLPQGLPHEYRAHRLQPWTVYWVHFQGSASGVFLQNLGYREGRPVISAGLSPVLNGNFNSLLEVRQSGYSTAAFINAANQLRHLLTMLALEAGLERGRGEGGFDLARVQAYMREHVDRPLSLDDLAALARLSKYHFSKRYKQLTGYSPIKHFLNMKMEYACRLLDSTDMTVQAVAGAVGYDDPLYFSRMFSKTIGSSPSAYRASIGR